MGRVSHCELNPWRRCLSHPSWGRCSGHRISWWWTQSLQGERFHRERSHRTSDVHHQQWQWVQMREPSERLEEKHFANPPSWRTNYQCFFAPARYMVIKIERSSFEVVLWTTKHMVIYPISGSSLEVIVIRPAIWYRRWTCVTRDEQRARDVHMVKGKMDLVPPVRRKGGFYRPRSSPLTMI
jgi:hypothetical protein